MLLQQLVLCIIRCWNDLANCEQDNTTKEQTQPVRFAVPGFAIRNCEMYKICRSDQVSNKEHTAY